MPVKIKKNRGKFFLYALSLKLIEIFFTKAGSVA